MMSPVYASGTTTSSVHDRLEQHDARCLDGFLQRERARDLERHVGGVDRVELPVDQRHLDVDHRVPADHAVGHRLHDALLDRRDELLRDRAAEDLVARRRSPRRAGAARSRCRRPRTGRARPSASRAGRAPLPLRRIVSRYAIFGGMVRDVDAELRASAAPSAPRGAPRPCRRSPSRASPRCARRGSVGSSSRSRARPVASLSSSPLVFGLDRVGEQRLGQLDRRAAAPGRPSSTNVSPVWACCSFATAPMSPAGTSATDLVLLAALREQLADPLLGALRGVVDRRVGPDRPGEHPEHRDVADERVRDGLEHERGERCRWGRCARSFSSPSFADHRRSRRDRSARGTPRR